jgi:hypothetical protein
MGTPWAAEYELAMKKAGIAPGLLFFLWRKCEAHFASARLGGLAGHDLISVS